MKLMDALPVHNKLDVTQMSRREMLVMFASAGAIMIVGIGGVDAAGSKNGNCIITPQLTAGPYFVDEHLNRSNIVGVQPGLPLRLNIKVYNANNSACAPLPGVHVDLWHSNGAGIYSDVANLGSAGKTFLRGYQVTDTDGMVSFNTIYPGWYKGRTPHIHLKTRMFNATGNQTLEASTQFFFDDAITDDVYAKNSPYNTRGARHIRNPEDYFYGGKTSLLVPLKGSATSGYTGAISIGISA